MSEFVWPVRVYYEDTDAGGVVYHANYLKFMERARSEWLREIGFDQMHLAQQHNLVFVVRQVAIDYFKPALFNDQLYVTAHVSKFGKASLTMIQQVLRDPDLLCMATVKIVAINTLNMRPQPFPPEVLTALQFLGSENSNDD